MKQDIKQFYDKNALAYEKYGSTLLVELLDKFIGEAQSKSIFLDLGSGVGQDAEYFSKKGFFTVGLDISEEMIKISQNRTFSFVPLIGDMRLPLPFPSGVFDRVWASSSLFTHLEKKERANAICEVSRVLKKSGVFGGIVKEADGTPFPFFSLTESQLLSSLEKIFPNQSIQHFTTKDGKKWIFFMVKQFSDSSR